MTCTRERVVQGTFVASLLCQDDIRLPRTKQNCQVFSCAAAIFCCLSVLWQGTEQYFLNSTNATGQGTSRSPHHAKALPA